MRSGLGTRRPYSSCCRVMRFQFLGRLHPSSPVSRERSACAVRAAASGTSLDRDKICLARSLLERPRCLAGAP